MALSDVRGAADSLIETHVARAPALFRANGSRKPFAVSNHPLQTLGGAHPRPGR
jgi:hypothetical protein